MSDGLLDSSRCPLYWQRIMRHGGRQRDLLFFESSKPSAKPELNGFTLALGDAEQIPYETDRFDRYVSAGSLEYLAIG